MIYSFISFLVFLCLEDCNLTSFLVGLSSKGEKASKLRVEWKDIRHRRHEHENYGPDHPSSVECVTSSSNIPGSTVGSLEADCVKILSGSDSAPPTKIRKLNGERSDPKKYVNLGHVF